MSSSEYNGVRSVLYDTQTELSASTVSRDRTFIFGTATQGARHLPVSPAFGKVEAIFGSVPTDSSFETSLVRGYYEYKAMVANEPNVALIRVGEIANARIDLYENTSEVTGDYSYSLSEGAPCHSMWLQAIPEGELYNSAYVEIKEESGFPAHMKITLPDGTVGTFNLAKVAGPPSVASSVSELVSLINNYSGFSNKIRAGFTPLSREYELTITALSGTVINTVYDLSAPSGTPNASYGDKMVGITEAYIIDTIEKYISAGETIVELDVAPIKVLSSGTSIDQFVRVSELEEILTVTAATAGQTDVAKTLYCASVTGWDNTYLISGNSTHDWVFSLYVKRNGSSTYTKLVNSNGTVNGDKYTLVTSTGVVTIHETLSVGDRYFVSYRFEVSYEEAKLKSELLSGSTRSYFIYGDSIIFGAGQPSNLYIYYDSKVVFSTNDLQITDAKNAVVEFTNAANMPAVGDTVVINYTYEPELPAATGKILTGGTVQPGAFAGGSDGRILSKKDYVKAVVKAIQAVELYPRKNIVVMGLYLDDVYQGPNEETGMNELKPLNWFSDILDEVDEASNTVSECSLMIPVRPLGILTQDAKNAWITSLTENSDTDLNRPANIIDSINNFRADAPVGCFVVQIPEVNSGRTYFANPASIYAGFKSRLSYKESATNAIMPGTIKDLGVRIFNSRIIGLLNEKRYTAAVVDINKKIIIADAPTLGTKNRSQFDRQFVRDGVFYAIELARSAAQPYIGKPRLPEFLTNMKLDVSKALSVLAPDFLSDFMVTLMPVADGYITGETKLKLTLVTAKEIRKVTLETYVQLSQ